VPGLERGGEQERPDGSTAERADELHHHADHDGAAMPTAGLRDQTESRIARQVNPSTGGQHDAQLPRPASARSGGMVCPDSPIRGWWPTISRLA
jgi:hypothetical protein